MDIKGTSNCVYCPGIHYRWAVKIEVTNTSSTDIKTYKPLQNDVVTQEKGHPPIKILIATATPTPTP